MVRSRPPKGCILIGAFFSSEIYNVVLRQTLFLHMRSLSNEKCIKSQSNHLEGHVVAVAIVRLRARLRVLNYTCETKSQARPQLKVKIEIEQSRILKFYARV